MSLESLGLFRLIAQRMDWLTARQTVLSQNIANANTPGYRARDLKPFASLLAGRGTAPLQMAGTQAGHMAPRGADAAPAAEFTQDPYETSPDGNQVALEQQLMQMTETAMDHQFATNIYRKQLGMISMALGRSR